ncbi:C2 domain [Trinorchestia longiramus]|nr:C2 domain [Trinorchestia longiramus]
MANQHLQERHLMGVPLQQLMGLRLESLRLGTKAPLVEWVRVVEHPEFGGRPDHYVLEALITYISDAELVLYSTKFKAGIRDLHVAGKLRVDFGPTITKMPLVAGICLYLLEPPVFDFNSTSTASALDMVSGELFTKLMHSFITKVITDLLVAPNSISVPFLDASAIRCPTPPGAIRVCVVEAKDLRSPDIIGKIDPYCIVRLGAEHSVTPCVKNAAHPRWGHWAQFVCTGAPAAGGQDLVFQVLDRDPVRTDAELLSLRLGTREIQEQKLIDKWLQPEGLQRGSLRVQALWLPFSDDPAQLPVQVAEIAALQSSSLGRKDTKEGFSTVPIDVGHAGSVVVANTSGFTLFSCLVLVWLDSAWELPESSGNWRVTVKTSESEQHSWTATETASGKWAWKQSFIFHLKNAHDTLTVKLRSNQGSTVKGHMDVRLQNLLELPKLSTGNKSWPLTLSTDRRAVIRMECYLKILSPAGKAMEDLKVINRKFKETTPPVILTELFRIGKSASRGNFMAQKLPENCHDCNSIFYPFPLIGMSPTAGSTSPRPPRANKTNSPPSSLRSSSSSSSLLYERQSSEDVRNKITWRKRKSSEGSGKFSVNRKSVSLEHIPPVSHEKGNMIVRSLKRFKVPSRTRRHVRDIFTSSAIQSTSVFSGSVVNLGSGTIDHAKSGCCKGS